MTQPKAPQGATPVAATPVPAEGRKALKRGLNVAAAHAPIDFFQRGFHHPAEWVPTGEGSYKALVHWSDNQ